MVPKCDGTTVLQVEWPEILSQNKQTNKQTNKKTKGPGAVAQACNPSTLGGQAGGSRGQEIETILVNMVKPRLY